MSTSDPALRAVIRSALLLTLAPVAAHSQIASSSQNLEEVQVTG